MKTILTNFLLAVALFVGIAYAVPTFPVPCTVRVDVDVVQMFVDSEDCSRFFVCVLGVLDPRECPEGLHFNFALQVCDRPENAGCSTT